MAKKKKRRALRASSRKKSKGRKPAKKPARKSVKKTVKKTAKKKTPAKRAARRGKAAVAKKAPAGKPAARSAYYVTTAISYPNGAPHIGHAYEAIATDAIARFQRLDGYDVFFQTGVDEHGLKMTQTAAKEGITARELSDRNTPLFKAMCDKLNISYDRFIRTTEVAHYKASQAIWQKMADAGDIYLGNYEGWYSVRDEAFYAESETQVGEDGVRRGPQGTPVEWTKEETYFFRLSAYQDKLLAYYKAHPDFILPETRRNEVISFVKGGLQDLSVSRTS